MGYDRQSLGLKMYGDAVAGRTTRTFPVCPIVPLSFSLGLSFEDSLWE